MTSYEVSIVIPVYNAQKYLCECLDSVLAQTCKDIEVLLVDDGSTDGTAAICDEYAVADSRIKVYHNTNSGANASRRFGTFKASGEYVYFIDADDTIAPDTIETALSIVQKRYRHYINFVIKMSSLKSGESTMKRLVFLLKRAKGLIVEQHTLTSIEAYFKMLLHLPIILKNRNKSASTICAFLNKD